MARRYRSTTRPHFFFSFFTPNEPEIWCGVIIDVKRPSYIKLSMGNLRMSHGRGLKSQLLDRSFSRSNETIAVGQKQFNLEINPLLSQNNRQMSGLS